MTDTPTPRHDGGALPPRRACPRCGARMGRLAPETEPATAAPPAADALAYCGCCGLVLPDSPVQPAPDAR